MPEPEVERRSAGIPGPDEAYRGFCYVVPVFKAKGATWQEADAVADRAFDAMRAALEPIEGVELAPDQAETIQALAETLSGQAGGRIVEVHGLFALAVRGGEVSR